ncbi:hypothetical protein BS17DRAFT_762234 [Gyrodon lividus]|nr:hypothetical protein BS17DRAFT_762234 [Gyrodon lividus]
MIRPLSTEVYPAKPLEEFRHDISEPPHIGPSLDGAVVLSAPPVGEHSLTVILPVISSTLSSLDVNLAPFLVSTNTVYEVSVICPDTLVSETRRRLRFILSKAPHEHPKVSLYPWTGLMNHHQASLAAVSGSKTDWVLLLDEFAFQEVTGCDRDYLVNPRALQLPAGPRGLAGSSCNSSQLLPPGRLQAAAYLIPPFVAQSSLLVGVPLPSPSASVWAAVGEHIAHSRPDMTGGLVIGPDTFDQTSCDMKVETEITFSDDGIDENEDRRDDDIQVNSVSVPAYEEGFFALAFPRKEDLRKFAPVACNLHRRGYTLSAFLYDTTDADIDFPSALKGRGCTIPYFQRSNEILNFSDWLDSLTSVPDIVIGLDHQDFVSATFSLTLERPPYLNITLIRLPRSELPHTEWMGTLTLRELRHWNVPEITISVITNDRLHSLQRLLTSVQSTLFYGDKITLRINMEQTCDSETMHLVQDFEWDHGDVFIHHRVIHGGLLPAVVESWYPHCNNSYGLLLEDDVELSPLSYAWVKMALLRYRYGGESPSSNLFGISLYQQKIIELRPEGRRPFNARTLFHSSFLAHPTTPYLSQIPCSWGALFFPSHWREFHDYLSLRLSQHTLPISAIVVPGVRSNKWTKSWKKYFIELVYLRGYVMLYPNYEDFVSFSTNHLEVGSHVKHEPGDEYERKKQSFLLPLMPLSDASSDDARGPSLLDFPKGTLPNWRDLPVLDLMGSVSSMEAIQQRGGERRAVLSECSGVASLPSSIRDLFCHIPL